MGFALLTGFDAINDDSAIADFSGPSCIFYKTSDSCDVGRCDFFHRFQWSCQPAAVSSVGRRMLVVVFDYRTTWQRQCAGCKLGNVDKDCALSTYTSESLTGPHCCAAPARYRSARQNICHACFDSIWRLIRPISLQHCTVPTVLYCVSVSASPLKILLCSAATDWLVFRRLLFFF